jgi:hypothetical protein
MDFMGKTRLVLNVAARECYFTFAPKVINKLFGEERSELRVHAVSLQGKVEGEIVTRNLAP